MQMAVVLAVGRVAPALRHLHSRQVHGQAAALGRPGGGRWQRLRKFERRAREFARFDVSVSR